MPLKPSDLDVSDHAVLRWLERAYGVDVESYRLELAREIADGPADVTKHIARDTRCRLMINGLIVCTDGMRVCTVVVEGE